MVTREYFFFLALIVAPVAFFLVHYGYLAVLTRIDQIEATELMLEELKQRKSDKDGSSPDIDAPESTGR